MFIIRNISLAYVKSHTIQKYSHLKEVFTVTMKNSDLLKLLNTLFNCRNPLVSSTAMKRRMEGRRVIKISSIQSQIRNNDIEGDWVTIGVVIQKLTKKTAKVLLFVIFSYKH